MTTHYRNHSRGSRPPEQSSVIHVPLSAPVCINVYTHGGKRALDVAIVVLAAPLVLLVVGILALLVALDGGQPFYTQDRVGRNRRHYKIWKLRSMVAGADEKLEGFLACNPEARAEWNKTQKLKSDPRITSFGLFLRRSSLDELPQLWNVLRGDMSLVGPRPMMPAQMALYPGSAYYDLRPGITGSWQVSARNESSFEDRAKFDTAYGKNVTLAQDARILFATVEVVLKGTGH